MFICSGDVLLSLDGQSLDGLGHREAAELLAKAPSVVTFSVWREEGERREEEGRMMGEGREEGGKKEERRMMGKGRESRRVWWGEILSFCLCLLSAIKGPPSIVTEVVVEHPPPSSPSSPSSSPSSTSSPPYTTTTLERDSTSLLSPPPHPSPRLLSPTPLVSGLALFDLALTE